MRITKELLYKFANETVKQRKRSEPDIHAAYLMGSLLDDEPLLGGTTDIDLVLVHKYLAPMARETTALTPEISVDILHKTQADFDPPRQFRQNALIGYPLTYYHILLYDTDHWLEFLQSSVTAEFQRADNVLGRVNNLLESAREGWRSLNDLPAPSQLDWLDQFLVTLEMGANAIAGLIGPPLTTRRFMMTFSQRLEELGTPEVWSVFCGLLGCSEDMDIKSKPWSAAFEEDLVRLATTDSPPPHLAPCRHAYYFQGIKALTHHDEPLFALWPLLRTWLDVQLALPQPSPGADTWQDLLTTLNFTESVRDGKSRALDAFLDRIEVLIETWADTYGFKY
jgi:hypothetical protein